MQSNHNTHSVLSRWWKKPLGAFRLLDRFSSPYLFCTKRCLFMWKTVSVFINFNVQLFNSARVFSNFCLFSNILLFSSEIDCEKVLSDVDLNYTATHNDAFWKGRCVSFVQWTSSTMCSVLLATLNCPFPTNNQPSSTLFLLSRNANCCLRGISISL